MSLLPGIANAGKDFGNGPKPGCTNGCRTSLKNVSETVSSDSLESALANPDLARIVAAWPTLPEVIRAGILAMVKAADGGEIANQIDNTRQPASVCATECTLQIAVSCADRVRIHLATEKTPVPSAD
jgi:hypothetical protein